MSFLKETSLYKYFNYHFLHLQNCIKENSNQINMLKNDISLIKNFQNKNDVNINKTNTYITTLEEKLDRLTSSFNILFNRLNQFEYTNTELLFLKEVSKPKILIVGFYGAPSTGDELMLQSLLEKIDSVQNSITVMIADNPFYKLENYKNINFIHYPKTNMDINIISNYFDKIIFGGGAVIDDTNFNRIDSYKYDTSQILIDLSTACILNNKKVYLLALSTSKTLTNSEFISKLDYIINNSEFCALRDTNSLETLKNSGLKCIDKIKIVHDLAFSLPLIPYNINELQSSEYFTIGLILITSSDINKLQNILLWIDEYSNKLDKRIQLKLIPFYDFCNSDTINLNRIIENLSINCSVEIVKYYYQYEDIIKIFNRCNLLINMRYHSSLLSLKNAIPSIHIVYDIHPHYENKMNYLKEKYMLPESFLSYNNLTKDNFDNCLAYILKNISQISSIENEISTKIVQEAKDQHVDIIKNIIKL